MRLWRNQRGALSIVTAGYLMTLLGFMAAVVDLGSVLSTRRELRAAADAAASAGSFDLTRAQAIAAQSVKDNGFGSNTTVSVTTGTYTGDPSVSASSRFTPGGNTPNALQVTLNRAAPTFFLRLFMSGSSIPLQVQAVAVNAPEGSFGAGSGLAAIDSPTLNSLLSAMVGGSVALTAANYQALASTDISLLTFSKALATQLGVSAGTYSNLLSTSVKMGDLVAAAETAAASSPQAQAALATLGTSVASNQTFPLNTLLDLGDWDTRQIGTINTATETAAGLNLLDFVMLASQVASSGKVVTLTLPGSISGVSSATLSLATGGGSQYAPRIGLGPVGISVHTAQTRLLFNFNVLPIATFNTTVLHLPIYLEVAEGTATLKAISCGSDPKNDAAMTLQGAPGVTSASIATTTASQMANFASPVTLSAATILSIPVVLQATALVTASASAPTPSNVAFSFQDIQDGTIKTVNSAQVTTGLMSSLATGLGKPGGLTVTVIGLGLSLGTITSQLLSSLTGVLSVVNTPIDTVLSSLGVRAGTIDLRATGMRCGIPVVVQ